MMKFRILTKLYNLLRQLLLIWYSKHCLEATKKTCRQILTLGLKITMSYINEVGVNRYKVLNFADM